MHPDANTPEVPPAVPAAARNCRSGRGRVAIVGILLAGAAVGAVATKAMSHGMPFVHHRHGAPGIAMLAAAPGPIDPARAEERASRMAKHFGVEVDATPAQQEKLTGIVRAAVKDLLPYRDKMQSTRKQGIDLLTAPTIDKEAVERLRAEQAANFETVSKRVSQALLDTAEILTPEQRKKLSERIAEFREHRGWGFWRKG